MSGELTMRITAMVLLLALVDLNRVKRVNAEMPVKPGCIDYQEFSQILCVKGAYIASH
jgi:hypothetical protein